MKVFAAVLPNDYVLFIYSDQTITIIYYILEGNRWNVYLFNFYFIK